jgi:hypothetical protein
VTFAESVASFGRSIHKEMSGYNHGTYVALALALGKIFGFFIGAAMDAKKWKQG